MKLKQLFTTRIIILVFFILISLFAIGPTFNQDGVAIRGVETNSSAEFAGISVLENIQPTKYERILEINGQKINSLEDYSNAISTDAKLTISTNKNSYTLLNENLGLTVENPASNNILKGLELQGGTRALIQPSEKLSEQQLQDLIDVMENRLNVYGLKQLIIKKASDFEGNKYIVIEIAGATKEEVKELIGQQGKFEAKIGNESVFSGGKQDIKFVCKGDGTCSGIMSCDKISEGYQCRFEFSIKLGEEAAKRHAQVTSDLDINISDTGYEYLSKPIDLYLDDKLVDSLNIASDLKGKEARDIAISGPGFGLSEQDAFLDATNNMNKLQTILITGALPTSLNVVKMDSISPSLGSTFEKNAIIAGLLALCGIGLVIFIRYRKLKISIPIIFICISETFITLGILTMCRYNLDLAAIAGIIAAVGTGVDDQIVISDEILNKESANWKERYKKAFFIIIAAYFATVLAMIPLWVAGVGLLRGFAVSTIIGVTIGVLVTRPAYASIIKVLLNE